MTDFRTWVVGQSAKLGYDFNALTREDQENIISALLSYAEDAFRSQCDYPDMRFGKRKGIYASGDEISSNESVNTGTTYQTDCFITDNDPQSCTGITYSGGCLDTGSPCANNVSSGCTNYGCTNDSGICTNDSTICTDNGCRNNICTNSNSLSCSDISCSNQFQCSNSQNTACLDCSCGNSTECMDSSNGCADYLCTNAPHSGGRFCTDVEDCSDLTCRNEYECNDNLNGGGATSKCVDSTQCRNERNCTDILCKDETCANINVGFTGGCQDNDCEDKTCLNYNIGCSDTGFISGQRCSDNDCLNESTSLSTRCSDSRCDDGGCMNNGYNPSVTNCTDINCDDISCKNTVATPTLCAQLDDLNCINTRCSNTPSPLVGGCGEQDTQSQGCFDVGQSCRATDFDKVNCAVDSITQNGCPSDTPENCIVDTNTYCTDTSSGSSGCTDSGDCINETNCSDNAGVFNKPCTDSGCQNTGGENTMSTCTDSENCEDNGCINNNMCLDESGCSDVNCTNTDCMDRTNSCSDSGCNNNPRCMIIPPPPTP